MTWPLVPPSTLHAILLASLANTSSAEIVYLGVSPQETENWGAEELNLFRVSAA